jgi:diketogulonate reductase-like aldo/keto reductase
MQADHRAVPRIALNDGSTIPQLGFGTLAVQPDRRSSDANAETTAEIVGRALQAGYRHIDTAQSYGTERMGENLAVFDFQLSAAETASIDALDQGDGGRVGPNPDTYEG